MQTDVTLLDVTCCVGLHTLLHDAACCSGLSGVVAQSLKPVKLLSQQLPTFVLFCDRRSVAQQCWIDLHSSSLHMVSLNVNHVWHSNVDRIILIYQYYGIIPNIVGSCCIRLHTSANTIQQLPTFFGPTMLGIVSSVCT